jgi:lactate dehydrogenase-like 2-hydroxyacid dehydrogenase
MTATPLLILGAAFSQTDKARLEAAHPACFADTPADITSLSDSVKNGIKAIAYKGHTPLDARVFSQLSQLGLVANYGVGYDAINIEDAEKHGIKVTNTPDVLNDDVADLAVGMMLAQSRAIVAGDHWVRSGTWAKGHSIALNRKLTGGSVGIVGLGRIGREIADRLAAFKMDIHYHSRSEKQTPNWTYHADVLSMATAVDTLVIALVGGKATENYVTREAIQALGPKGVVINISRGTTIDEAALIDALERGEIAGAGLDVFLDEPKVNPRFYPLENVILQPHQGSATHETRQAMAELQLANITAYLSGDALLTPVS